MTGPHETEQQMRELPAVRAIYDAMRASHRRGVMGELGYRLLDEACEAAGVKVGAHDHRILIQLAGFEPETHSGSPPSSPAHEVGAAAGSRTEADGRWAPSPDGHTPVTRPRGFALWRPRRDALGLLDTIRGDCIPAWP